MNWTSEKPKEAGWSWNRINGVVGVALITRRDCQLYAQLKFKDAWLSREGWLDYIHGEWLGPITPDSYQQGRVAACKWKYDDIDDRYETACKHAYCLIDGTLQDNDHKYCQYCGGVIQLAQQAQEGKEVGDAGR